MHAGAQNSSAASTEGFSRGEIRHLLELHFRGFAERCPLPANISSCQRCFASFVPSLFTLAEAQDSACLQPAKRINIGRPAKFRRSSSQTSHKFAGGEGF
jgi:hypothetical protein